MEKMKLAVEQGLISEKEASKLLEAIKNPVNMTSTGKKHPYLKFGISPGGEVYLPLDVTMVDENAIKTLLRLLIKEELMGEPKFNELLAAMVDDVTNVSGKGSFSYVIEEVEHTISAEIVNA